MTTYLHVLSLLRQSEKDLVIGFYRLNYNRYISMDVIQLSMMYLFILDEFDDNIHSDNIKIKGFNNNICECITSNYGTAFSRNIISSTKIKKENYYHWRFETMHRNNIKSTEATKQEKQRKFAIGIIKNDDEICEKSVNDIFAVNTYNSDWFGFIGHYLDGTYRVIIDMYLDFSAGHLNFVYNNTQCVTTYDNIDINNNYRMTISLSGDGYSMQLIGYQHSKTVNCIGFASCIYNINERIKYYKHCIDLYPNMNELHCEYIDCLVISRKYDDIYEYIIKKEMKELSEIITVQAMKKLIVYFYGIDEYSKVTAICNLMDNDTILIEAKICFEIAYCFGEIKQPIVALKYYNLYLNESNELNVTTRTDTETAENIKICLNNMGLTYYYDLDEYKLALECFLKLGDDEINERNLEYKIAFSYEMLKEYDKSLIYWNKYRLKHPDNPDSVLPIAMMFESKGDLDTAQEYFLMALNMDKEHKHYEVHAKYANFMGHSRENYKEGLKLYEIALQIASNNEEKSESYKGIGVMREFLGDIDDAIFFTKKALEFNENNASAANNLGYYYLITSEYELSYKYLSKSLKIEPLRNLTNGNLGNCLYEMGRYDEAIQYLEESLSRDIDLNHQDIGPKCLEYHANIMYMKQEYQKSINRCNQLMEREEFIKNNNNKDKIYYLLCKNYEKLDNLDECLKFAKMATNLKPNNQCYQALIQKLDIS